MFESRSGHLTFFRVFFRHFYLSEGENSFSEKIILDVQYLTSLLDNTQGLTGTAGVFRDLRL